MNEVTPTPIAPWSSCSALVPSVCANFTFDFPLWEVLASVLVTAVVTFFTIRWSVKAASRETMRAIRHNLESEKRAARLAERRERAVLAGRLMEAVSELSDARRSGEKPRRLTAEAQWRAIRTTFDASPLSGAHSLYEFANLRIAKAELQKGESRLAVEFVTRQFFVEDIRSAALEWAERGALSDDVQKRRGELQEWYLADRARRVQELVERVDAARSNAK